MPQKPRRLSGRSHVVVQSHPVWQPDRRIRREFGAGPQAFDVLGSGRARKAFDLSEEPERVRAAYGPTKWGQSLLLGRRLIEAGARLVHVNWCREPGDEAVNNPMWDTHAQNADRLQDVLCPLFDVTFSTLLDDLDERGLLSETLVVAIGEFGRTPKINPQGGRDHWGHVFSFALAGAGIAGGQVLGSSDRQGGYPRDGRMEPQELTATILHLLGIGASATFPDASGRPMAATLGRPLTSLLGDRPATAERVVATGNLCLVPPFSQDQLRNTSFEDPFPLAALGGTARLKGWRATPLASPDSMEFSWGCRVLEDPGQARSGRHCAALGFGWSTNAATLDAAPGQIAQGSRLTLTQEIRNPRAGEFEVAV
ncbi:MAG: DUF1501 domain-containing protein, partial [Planctomycetaceae bacterium]